MTRSGRAYLKKSLYEKTGRASSFEYTLDRLLLPHLSFAFPAHAMLHSESGLHCDPPLGLLPQWHSRPLKRANLLVRLSPKQKLAHLSGVMLLADWLATPKILPLALLAQPWFLNRTGGVGEVLYRLFLHRAPHHWFVLPVHPELHWESATLTALPCRKFPQRQSWEFCTPKMVVPCVSRQRTAQYSTLLARFLVVSNRLMPRLGFGSR